MAYAPRDMHDEIVEAVASGDTRGIPIEWVAYYVESRQRMAADRRELHERLNNGAPEVIRRA